MNTSEELFAAIQKANLVPVPISREGEAEEILNYYEGDLAQFLFASKTIGATAVLVMTHSLEEEDFLYFLSEDSDEDLEPDPSDEVDLSAISPALAKYKKRIGSPYSFFLMAKGGAADLCLEYELEWFKDFENERDHAEGMAVLAGKPRSES